MQIVQCILAEQVRVALARCRQLNDLLGEHFEDWSSRNGSRNAERAISNATPMILLVSASKWRPLRNGVIGMTAPPVP
jgi:hypothetical protein